MKIQHFNRTWFLFSFSNSYLLWRGLVGTYIKNNVVLQIGWDFSHSGSVQGSMFNQFFTLLSRPGKAEWTICLFKMFRCGFFFQFTFHPQCGWPGVVDEIFVERRVKLKSETSWIVELFHFILNWSCDKKECFQSTEIQQGRPRTHTSFIILIQSHISHQHANATNKYQTSNNKSVSINLNWNRSVT